jgi:beta-lactamase regulating signal transducer with metallopeptidase domain
VVRQRAKAMQARRSHVRGLMAPMIICSALLLLIAFAVWSGLYQNPANTANAADLVQTDVAGPAAAATPDANNRSVVALLWFVPACLAVPAMVLYRRRRESAVEKAGR